MRITFVVQRYGDDFVGGAEKYVFSMASRLSQEGHEIKVVTSCATSYADWANVYPPGETVEHGVTVHRLPVRASRDNARFGLLHQRAIQFRPVPLWPWGQDRWSAMMGPDLAEPEAVLRDAAAWSDATVVVGYHYSHSLRLAKIVHAHGPTIVVPTAHPEGAFHVGWVRQMFDHADRIVCLSPEEGELVAGVYGHSDQIRHVPCPVDPITPPSEKVIDAAVEAVGVTRCSYGVAVGRIDPAKGSDDVVRFVDWYRRSIDPRFELVVVGPGATNVDVGTGVHLTGFVDEATKNALIAGAAVLIQPSYMESFSLALIEGWLLGRPALVQRRSRVLAGHILRSGGGLAYDDYLTFEAALATIRQNPAIAAGMAERGLEYSRSEFDWPRVRERFLAVVEELA